MESNEQKTLTNKIEQIEQNRLINTENWLTAVREEGVGRLGEKCEGIKQKRKRKRKKERN